jgi:hypothetical protein
MLAILYLLLAASMVEVRVSPTVGHSPLEIKITITNHVPISDARIVCMVISDGIEQSSCWPPDLITKTATLKGLTEGNWQVWATVELTDGRVLRSSKVPVEVR